MSLGVSYKLNTSRTPTNINQKHPCWLNNFFFFSGSQLSRLLEVMDARKIGACEEDSRISVVRPVFPRILRPSTCSASYFFCNRLRVLTGHRKPGKSWNLRISFSWPGKSWKIKFLFGRLVTEDDKARIT